ncbi:MAG: GTPase, partial [Eudoraea sp.]|nr:GTPase [Eudoraea sp.]
LRPATYSCNLCQLTHGAFRERKVWKDFRQSSQLPMQFLYKDEFLREYASKFSHAHTFPVVLGRTGSGLELVVSSNELNGLETAEELIGLLKSRN